MNNRYLFIIVVIGAVLGSCKGKRWVSEKELKAYLIDPDHGVVQRVVNEDFVAEVYYRPVDLVIARELDEMPDSAGNADSVKARYDSLDYFVLKISRDNREIVSSFATQSAMFNNVINYLNGGIVNDLRISVGSKLMLPEQSAYVRTFGVASASSVMVVFKGAILKQQEYEDDIVLTWEDTMMETGIHEFKFKLKNIKKIPSLNL